MKTPLDIVTTEILVRNTRLPFISEDKNAQQSLKTELEILKRCKEVLEPETQE